MAYDQLIGPAVIAATLAGVFAIITLWVNRSTSIRLHNEKIQADMNLAERKFDFDKQLAEEKINFDQRTADWKRRTELAEIVLADFYKARDIFISARSPFAFAGEGSSRPRRKDENENDASGKDAIYAPLERLTKELAFLSEMHSRRFRMMALFGNDVSKPFMEFIKAYNEITVATQNLLDDRRRLKDETREKFEKSIGWGYDDNDPIKERLDLAVAEIEAICRPVLETKPK